MKVPHGEGVATHTGPESCVVVRKGRGEALTGGRAGRPLSRETNAPSRQRRLLRGADVVQAGGRQHLGRRYREAAEDPARSETPSMHASTSHGTREVPGPSAAEGAADRIGKSKDERR